MYDDDGTPPAGLGVTKITDFAGERITIEVDPAIVEGIVYISKELCNPMRHCNAEEMINISMEAREKLQKAAEALGLMDRIAKEAEEDSDKMWNAQQAHEKLKSMGPARFRIVSDEDDA